MEVHVKQLETTDILPYILSINLAYYIYVYVGTWWEGLSGPAS